MINLNIAVLDSSNTAMDTPSQTSQIKRSHPIYRDFWINPSDHACASGDGFHGRAFFDIGLLGVILVLKP